MTEEAKAIVSDSERLHSLMDTVKIAGGAECIYVSKRKIEHFFNNTISSIETPTIDNSNTTIYYDLLGRRVRNPQNGIYLQSNGKKRIF